MTQFDLVESIKKAGLFQRDFIVNDTLKLLLLKRTWFWSWGANSPLNIDNKGLMLNVRGHHHKGKILITLAWNDTYSLTLINTVGNIKETFTEIYFEDLAEFIDKKIERIGAYQS